MNCLVYLNWPERCFRVTAGDLRFLRTLLPRGARVTVARDDGVFLRSLPKATHVITWHFRREWFALAPKLKVLATPAAGRELVAADAPKGVTVHFGGFHSAIISETVLAFVLAWTHGFFQIRSMPLWPRSLLADAVVRDLAGSRAVIVGYGRIGRAIGKRLEAYGVSVRGFTHAECDALKGKCKIRNSSLVTLRSSLACADWLIAALPSDTGTDDFVDAKVLAKVPSRCVFVNVGRGNCVDERALLAALKAGRLAGAYLDVYKDEPTVLTKVRSKSEEVRSKDKSATHHSSLVTCHSESDLAMLPESKCPWNLIRMPHASAYSPSYVKMAFKELKDEGLLEKV